MKARIFQDKKILIEITKDDVAYLIKATKKMKSTSILLVPLIGDDKQ